MKLGYITKTQRQSNIQWSGGIAPKNSERKNPLEEFSPQFFGIKTASSSLIIFQRAKLSMQSITHLCWCKCRIFLRKNTKGVSFLHDNVPAHWALETQKKLTYLGFQCLNYPPYSLDLAPSNYHQIPGLKKQLKGRHFSLISEVIAAVETWLDRQPSEFFLSGLQKL
jgi:hypothetical protein